MFFCPNKIGQNLPQGQEMNHLPTIDFSCLSPAFLMISESPGSVRFRIYLPLKRTTSKFTTENQVDWKMIHVLLGVFSGLSR